MKKTGQKTDYVMKYFSVIRIISAIAIALLIVFAIIFMVSDQPVFAIRKLVLGPLETKRSFFNVLERAVPLIFSGLALNIILRSGVFSIAADGSFYMGAVVATAMAVKIQLPNIVHQCALILVAAIILYTMIKNALISAIAAVIGEVILVVIYVVKSSVFEGGIQKVLNIFNLSGHFDNFTSNIFDIKGIVYFLSVIAVCLFLTMQSISKRRWN